MGFRPNDWARDLIALYIIILTFTLYAIFMSEAQFQACLDFFFQLIILVDNEDCEEDT